MRKKLICIAAIVILAFQSMAVSAADDKRMFKEFHCYTANIYVCDTKNSAAILLNVKPVSNNTSLALTMDIEYTAIPICKDAIYGSKGQKLSMDVINGYLLDSPVRVVIGRNGYGYKILYMNFLK